MRHCLWNESCICTHTHTTHTHTQTHTHTHTITHTHYTHTHYCNQSNLVYVTILGTVLVPKRGSSYVKHRSSVGCHFNTIRGTYTPSYQIVTTTLHVLILNTEPSSWSHLKRGFCNSKKDQFAWCVVYADWIARALRKMNRLKRSVNKCIV
jgi:hypothetical protein